jgi:hypothetical protein
VAEHGVGESSLIFVQLGQEVLERGAGRPGMAMSCGGCTWPKIIHAAHQWLHRQVIDVEKEGETKLAVHIIKGLESGVTFDNFISGVSIDTKDSFDSIPLGSFKLEKLVCGEVHGRKCVRKERAE